jgi:thioredoxin reductase (NADPH)
MLDKSMDKPVILTVDDDPQVLRSIARDLRQRYGEEYSVLRAESGALGLQALDELSEAANPVALLVSDQRMPEMDGVTFLTQARRRYPDSKRALLTAYADTDAAIAAINQSQVDYYLTKPWDPPSELLYPVIDDLLDDWKAHHKLGYGGLRIVGSRWLPQSHAIKDFLARNHIPYEFLDVELDENAKAFAARLESPTTQLPLVKFPTGEKLYAPSVAELAHKLGLRTTAAAQTYDFAVIGGGPAGLAAAVYGASEGLKTVLIEREAPGGQAGTSSRIENYLGFPSGLSGADLARRAVAQARKFDVEILNPQEICSLSFEGPYKLLTCGDGARISCKALMLSTGVRWRHLDAPGAEALTGSGIYYGAATTEAIYTANENVYIIGAGNSAGQAAVYFAEHATRVVMVVRGKTLGEKMSQYLVTRLEMLANVEIQLQSEVAECHGEGHLEGITLRNRATGEETKADTKFLFVFIGAEPNTEWLNGSVARDAHGFILTGADLKQEHLSGWPLPREPFLLEASVPGVFVAGDVRHESIKRVASAVGEGSVAVHFVHRYLAAS